MQHFAAPAAEPSGPSPQTHDTDKPSRPDLSGMDYADQVAALSPLQLKDTGGSDGGGDIRAHAAEGIRGPSRALPHQAAIQESFGRHDVSGIAAHVGGPAAEATQSMGAEAFAMDHHVAFGAQPSLHTAAHEAAHVVQQRGGVALKGGIGQSGDTYEQHADAVADAVVAGRSAEGLLDRHAGAEGASASNAGAVQRKETDGEKEEAPTAAPAVDPVVAEGAKALEQGKPSWRWLPSSLDGDEHTVIFDDSAVHRVQWYLFAQWLGISSPSFPNPMLESKDGAAPGWVGALRTKALTFRQTALTDATRPYAQTTPGHHAVAEGDPTLVTIANALCDAIEEQTPAQKFRAAVVAKADANVGNKLMDDEEFKRRSARKPGYTSCIDTITDHLSAGSSAAGGDALDFSGPNDYQEINPKVYGNPTPGTKTLAGAWVGLWEGNTYDAEKGKTARPKPGDLIIQTAADRHMVGSRQFVPGMFKHIATFRSAGPLRPDGTEEWITVDGGNEKSGGGKAAPVQERIMTFDVARGTVKKGSEERRLHGWIDIEVMYTESNPKQPS